MLLRKEADSRYTIKSQLPPAIAATIIAIQYAVNYQTFMVFLYLYVHSISSLISHVADEQDLQFKDPSSHAHG
jgi:hypothetical protein